MTEDADAVHDIERTIDAWRPRSSVIYWMALALLAAIAGRSEGLHEAQRASWSAPAHGTGTASEPHLSLALINTAFRESIDSALARRGAPLQIIAWEWGRDGSLVLDLRRPNLTWASLAPTERAGLMGVIAASYTAFLVRMRVPLDLAHRGHPVVALAYEGDNHALAIRTADGRVHVYGTPGDSVAAPAPVRR